MVGGPNGAGKSTFSSIFLTKCDYINGDAIKKEHVDQGRKIDAFTLKDIVREKVNDHLRNKTSFAFESNLTNNYNYDIAQEAAGKGYSTHLYYLGVNDLEVLNSRIAERVTRGLHYISPIEVKKRFDQSLIRLPSNLKWFDEATLLDNSGQKKSADKSEIAFPEAVMELKKGIIVSKNSVVPSWLERVLPTIEKLDKAYRKIQAKQNQ